MTPTELAKPILGKAIFPPNNPIGASSVMINTCQAQQKIRQHKKQDTQDYQSLHADVC